MKGLFYKEGRCLWQYGKSYILLVVIFFGLTFLNKGGGGANPLWLLYPVFFVGSLPASLLSADERDGWLAYCDTLPIGRRQLVAAKYVTSAVLTALIITLVLLISALTGQPTVAGGTAVPLSTLIPLLLAVGSAFIWDFEVTGNDTVPTETILRALEDYGITVGSPGLHIDQETMRNHVLLALPDADLADAAAESARTRTELGLYERPEGADMEAGEGEA